MNLHKIKLELKILLLSLTIGIICTTLFSLKTYSKETVDNLSNKIVRFRVLANSNSDYDQALKLIVKDSVITYFEDELKSFNNRSEALQSFNDTLYDIEEYAQKIVNDLGYNYNVSAKIDFSKFPTRTYGNVSLPYGDYETLIIEIGDGTGDNWWCVMFPPLCFVDETMEYVPENIDNQLQITLDDDEYNLVTNSNIEYNVKFKIIELFN